MNDSYLKISDVSGISIAVPETNPQMIAISFTEYINLDFQYPGRNDSCIKNLWDKWICKTPKLLCYELVITEELFNG